MTFAHLTMATRDVAASATFYQETLGWKLIHHADNIEQSAAWLEMGPNQQLHLLQVPDYEPSPFEREFGRHVAVFVPLREFADLKQRLVDQGAELIAPERATLFERFFFRDPQGYVVEVIDHDGYAAE